jgi:hypothetical protein
MDLMRTIPPEEKLQRTFEYSAFLRKFGEAGLRQKYPQAGDREIFLRAAHQRLGADLYAKVYGAELSL